MYESRVLPSIPLIWTNERMHRMGRKGASNHNKQNKKQTKKRRVTATRGGQTRKKEDNIKREKVGLSVNEIKKKGVLYQMKKQKNRTNKQLQMEAKQKQTTTETKNTCGASRVLRLRERMKEESAGICD